jgi:hypothetical protein
MFLFCFFVIFLRHFEFSQSTRDYMPGLLFLAIQPFLGPKEAFFVGDWGPF